MKRIFITTMLSLIVPASAFAAAPSSFVAARSLLAASSSPGNEYAAGATVVLTAPVEGDFSAVGGSIVVASPIAGDELLFAGSISSRAQVKGDVRAAAGSISIKEPVAGDLVLFGYSVEDAGRANGSVFVVAADTTLSEGAGGPVTVYGNNASLGGEFAGNVHVVLSGHLTLLPGTIVHGKLSYQAPETATIPDSAQLLGGVEYTNASYLPDAGTSRTLGLISIVFFIFVRILGALILAGLLAGLFPRLGEEITERMYAARTRSILLTMLLGFAVIIVTPVLLVLLLLTFVGIGLALLLLIAYALLMMLAVIYSGIFLGSIIARRFAHRENILWRDGVLGMLALSLIGFLPFIGLSLVFLLTTFVTGALLLTFFHFVFPREAETPEML